MIAKIKSNANLKATIDYNLKEASELIGAVNLCGDDINDFKMLMTLRQDLFSGRAKNLTAHIILSPSIEDGNTLTTEDWKSLGEKYLIKMGLGDQQSILFLHEDRQHKHLHIVTNRIQENGKIWRAKGNEKNMSQKAGHELAKEFGLKVQKLNPELGEKIEVEKTDAIGVFAKIKADLNSAIADSTKSGNFDEHGYFSQLETLEYEITYHYDKVTGEKRGYGIKNSAGNYFNASDLGKSFTLTQLRKAGTQKNNSKAKGQTLVSTEPIPDESKTEQRNHAEEKKDIKEFEREFTRVLDIASIGLALKNITSGYRYATTEDFIKALEDQGFRVHLRYDFSGIIGYTIHNGIEHYRDTDFPDFSLAQVMEKGILRKDLVASPKATGKPKTSSHRTNL